MPPIKVIFKNCAPFTNGISRINNTHVDDAHDIDVVTPMYDLIKYSDNYSKTSGPLWQYCRYALVLNAGNGNLVDFNADNATTDSFKIKEKITGDDGTKNVEIMVQLKYLITFWRIIKIPLINCEINLHLNWSEKCVKVTTAVANQGTTFSITDTKLYVPVVNLSTQDNVKLLE